MNEAAWIEKMSRLIMFAACSKEVYGSMDQIDV